MLKKCLITIAIILSVIVAKNILFNYKINSNYEEITKAFKRDYESTKKISSELLYQYKNFLEENGKKSDISIVDTYIKYMDSTLSKKEEETVKSNIYESKYLNSKILGGSLLYKHYLENNRYTEAKEIIEDVFNGIKRKQFKNNINEISYFVEMIASEPDDKTIAIDILESLIDNNYRFRIDRINLEIYEELRLLYLYTNNYPLASEASIASIIIANQLNLYEQTSEGLIELAQIFKKIGGIETGIGLLKKSLSIEIEDEFINANLKTYGLLTLSDFYLAKNSYKAAKLTLEQISNYKESIPTEHYRDIEIIKHTIDARIAIMENNLELAEEHLNYSKHLLEIDEEDYYLGKETSYLFALGEFYEATHQYEKAIQLYESMLNENEDNEDVLVKVLNALIRVEDNPNTKNDYYSQVLELQVNEAKERYGDYTFYILDKIKNENKLIEKNESISKNYMLIIILILVGGLTIGLLSKKIKDIKIKSTQDVLVDAYNRKYFDISYQKLLNENKLFSIIILDLDNFKSINDTFGHEVGDIVLKNACKVIQPLLDEQSSLFRYGGEEFVVIVKDKSRQDVLQLAENIRARIESLSWKEDIITTVSIGIAHSDIDGNDILNKADEKLYISKKTGKNKITT